MVNIEYMNQIKRFLCLTILLSNFVGLFANIIEPINVRKIGNMAEESLSFESCKEAIDLYYKLDSHIPESSSGNMSQIGLSYLYSNLVNEQVIPNIEKSAEKLFHGEFADVLCSHLGEVYQVNYDEQETKKISKVPAKEAIENTSSDGDVDNYTAAYTIEIKFGFDTSELDQAYLKDIEVLFATYKQHKEAYIEISGHTDSKGSDSHNKVLAQLRADAVKKYLVNKGIPKDRIITKAIGEEQPISPNINPDGSDNPEGRSNNRRTDIKIVNY